MLANLLINKMTKKESARLNMVRNQLRPGGVSSTMILDAFLEVEREDFLDGYAKDIAYSDSQHHICKNRVMLAPNVLGQMLQSLQLDRDSTVLEIAANTGYATEVIAHIARRVTAVENINEMCKIKEERFRTLHNIRWLDTDIYDAQSIKEKGFGSMIISGGAVTEFPATFLGLLKEGAKVSYIKYHNKHLSSVMLGEYRDDLYQEVPLFEIACPLLT